MARLSILLIALIAVPCGAFGGTEDDDPSIGRYQIAVSGEGLYFLNTTTGELWLKGRQGEWNQVDSPVKQKLKSGEVPRQAVSLTLPKAGETMPIVQREKRAIPGQHLSQGTG